MTLCAKVTLRAKVSFCTYFPICPKCFRAYFTRSHKNYTHCDSSYVLVKTFEIKVKKYCRFIFRLCLLHIIEILIFNTVSQFLI